MVVLIEGDKDVGDEDAGGEGGLANDGDDEGEGVLADFDELMVVGCDGMTTVDSGHEGLSERKVKVKSTSPAAVVHIY